MCRKYRLIGAIVSCKNGKKCWQSVPPATSVGDCFMPENNSDLYQNQNQNVNV